MAKPSFWTWKWYHRFFCFFVFSVWFTTLTVFCGQQRCELKPPVFHAPLFSFPCQSQPSESLPSDSEQVFTGFFPAPLLGRNILPQHGIPFAFCFWSNRVWDASFHQCPVRINPTPTPLCSVASNMCATSTMSLLPTPPQPPCVP